MKHGKRLCSIPLRQAPLFRKARNQVKNWKNLLYKFGENIKANIKLAWTESTEKAKLGFCTLMEKSRKTEKNIQQGSKYNVLLQR